MTDVPELAIANVTTAFFAGAGGWVAVLVETAVYRGAARAHRDARSTCGICGVADFTFVTVLVTQARWSWLTSSEIVALVASAQGKLTGIVGGAFTRCSCGITNLACGALRVGSTTFHTATGRLTAGYGQHASQ